MTGRLNVNKPIAKGVFDEVRDRHDFHEIEDNRSFARYIY